MIQLARDKKFKTLEDLAFRYKSLDEEYQVALLQNYIKLFTKEELEELPQNIQDNCIPFTDELYYFINTDNEEIFSYIKNLILSAIDMDVSYAYNLLAFSYYTPPNEPEQLLSQFRKARLEEDGFVSFEESESVFAVSGSLVKRLMNKYNNSSSSKESETMDSNSKKIINVSYDLKGRSFLSYVIEFAKNADWTQTDAIHLELKLLYLANCLTTACQLDPTDVKGCLRLMDIIKSVTGLGLEYISGGDPSKASNILQKENLKLLFQSGLYILHMFQDSIISKLEQIGVDRTKTQYIKTHMKEQKWANVLNYLDSEFISEPGFDLRIIATLKACFNRFPMKKIKKNVFDSGLGTDSGSDSSKVIDDVFSPIGSLHDLKEAYEDVLGELENLNKDTKIK